MSGKDLIDDYLSELMDDPDKGAPASKPSASKPAKKRGAKPEPAIETAETAIDTASHKPTPAQADSQDPPPKESPAEAAEDADDDLQSAGVQPSPNQSAPAATPAQPQGDPLAAFRDGGANISDDEFEAMLDALNGKPPAAAPASTPAADEAERPATDGDPLAAFRDGGSDISDDEFEAMLDALQGKPGEAPSSAAPNSAEISASGSGDPLATFREGGDDISDDEFEAMLDALSGQPPPPAPAAAPAAKPSPPPPAPLPATALASLEAPAPRNLAELTGPLQPEPPERRRRAEDKVSSWLRFNVDRQCFAVEVLKVQEVLRVPTIMPVRGTGEAMLGVMNLRGQIVPVMDAGIRLGFGAVEVSEASRVVVLEETGDALGLLVSAVADVINLSDYKIERISGTPSLVNSEIVRGISRREGSIIILLDATRMLAL